MKTFICSKVKKKGGGSPADGALCQFFDKVDADPDWLPGKASYDSCGHPAINSSTDRPSH